MNEKNIKLIEKAMEKWSGKDMIDDGTENCALCQEYRDNNSCNDCPVAKFTGVDGCKRTPYIEWAIHHRIIHNELFPPLKIECSECDELRQKEFDFLKAVLEKEKMKSVKHQTVKQKILDIKTKAILEAVNMWLIDNDFTINNSVYKFAQIPKSNYPLENYIKVALSEMD